MTIGMMTPPLMAGKHYNAYRDYAACKATAIIAGALDLESYHYDPDTGCCTGLIDGHVAVRVNPDIVYDPVLGYQWTGKYIAC